MAKISTTALRARWPGKDRWLSDGAAHGAGGLAARITRNGTKLYFQHFVAGKLKRIALGPYSESGERGFDLVRARNRAAELAALYRNGTTDLHAHLEREREAAERAIRAQEEAARRRAEDAKRGTLRQLLDAYIGHLERLGKQSARDVRSIFTTHVLEEAPDLADRKATDVPLDEFVRLVGKVVDAGKGRTAGKLRSYLRAAYQLAIRSQTDPDAPLTMRSFGITANPIASMGALSRYNRVRDRVLSAQELTAFLKRIEELRPGAQRDALQLCILLGGQRPAQLLRLRARDVDIAGGTITLYDPKGARQQPRPHMLPLVKEAAATLQRRLGALQDGEPVFSTDGSCAMRVETLDATLAQIVEKMRGADPPEAREDFQLRDLRRTCETMLAALNVSRDVRAQLQSHGLGGVQQRHYDRHDYMAEKRHALEKWKRHLEQLKTGRTPKVVSIGRAAPAA